MKQSAGALLYRHGVNGWEVLLVHASGNYNRRAPWGIPKGLVDDGESLEETARRETEEETGLRCEVLFRLGDMIYKKSRKQVHCFAGLAPADAKPRCASWEVDQAEFLSIEDARQKIHPDQAVFLERLQNHLEQQL